MNEKALVVLSGGQDSTTCLYWAIKRFGPGNVDALTFDYGQRHEVEIQCARDIAAFAGVPHAILPIDTFSAIGGNALTDLAVDVGEATNGDLPSTFVPGRNLIFLTFAAASAWRKRIKHLVTGVAQTDYSGYPDCRQDTIDALQQSIALGMDFEFEIHTPLMNLSKKQTVDLAIENGAIDAMHLTITCYNGVHPPCGGCPACVLRAKGFLEAGVADPLFSK